MYQKNGIAGEWRLSITLVLAASGLLAAQRGFAADAKPESAVAAEAWSQIRGTTSPLPARNSALRILGHGLLVPPYAAVRIAAWPIQRTLWLEDRFQIRGRVANLLTFDKGSYEAVFQPFVGYETSTGFSSLGGVVNKENWLSTGAKLRIRVGYSSNDRNIVRLAIRTPPRKLTFSLLAERRERENRPFYGLGRDSPEVIHRNDEQRTLLEAAVQIHGPGRWRISIRGFDQRLHLEDPGSDEPVSLGFPALFTTARESEYMGLEAGLAFDTRDQGQLSRQGGLIRFIGGSNRAQSDGDADYRHYSVEGQFFLNLYRHSRVLALRVFAEGIDSGDVGEIPYTQLSRLGGKAGPRGYSRYRFADRNSVLLTAEYRYVVATRFMASLFTDWGAVSPDWDHLRPAENDPSFGIGLTLISHDFPLTFQVSRSPEGVELFFGLHSLFETRSRRLR